LTNLGPPGAGAGADGAHAARTACPRPVSGHGHAWSSCAVEEAAGPECAAGVAASLGRSLVNLEPFLGEAVADGAHAARAARPPSLGTQAPVWSLRR